jgi:hypothetical protein
MSRRGPDGRNAVTDFFFEASKLYHILFRQVRKVGVKIVQKIGFIAFTMLFFAGLASAQIPTSGNVFFGYSYYNTDLSSIDRANTNGWEASVEGKIIPWVGIVADFDSHYGSQDFPTGCPLAGGVGCTLNDSFTAADLTHPLRPQSAEASTIKSSDLWPGDFRETTSKPASSERRRIMYASRPASFCGFERVEHY